MAFWVWPTAPPPFVARAGGGDDGSVQQKTAARK